MNVDYAELFLETRSKAKSRLKHNRGRSTRAYKMKDELGFQCRHCGFYVLADPIFSGVRNRNHCPYCLWSRCLDLFEAGDRLSPCKSPMQPVGLALKKTRKKYGPAAYGELMIVHHCSECGKSSANRIAADDDTETIYSIFRDSIYMKSYQKEQIEAGGVQLLNEEHEAIVSAQLFGTHPPGHYSDTGLANASLETGQ
jgi:hypothetical protein